MTAGNPDGDYRGRSRSTLAPLLMGAIVLLSAFIGLSLWQKRDTAPGGGDGQAGDAPSRMVVRLPVAKPPAVMDYDRLEKDEDFAAMMDRRKAEYGLEDSVDMIVRADERLQIGDRTLSMGEILDQIRLAEGGIVEKDIRVGTDPLEGHEAVFGIHVVRPNDNIWNIHFDAMREYFSHKGIALSPMADEPDTEGYSSGVGKILKFSENIVYIYNVQENRLDPDPHLLEPLSKVVIYNLGRLSALLDQIDVNKVDRVHFDGETLWIPARS